MAGIYQKLRLLGLRIPAAHVQDRSTDYGANPQRTTGAYRVVAIGTAGAKRMTSEVAWRLDRDKRNHIPLDANRAKHYRIIAVWLRASAAQAGDPNCTEAGKIYDDVATEIERLIAEQEQAA